MSKAEFIPVGWQPDEAEKVWNGKLPCDAALVDMLENALYKFQTKYKVRLAVIHRNREVQPISLLSFALVLAHYVYEEEKRRGLK